MNTASIRVFFHIKTGHACLRDHRHTGILPEAVLRGLEPYVIQYHRAIVDVRNVYRTLDGTGSGVESNRQPIICFILPVVATWLAIGRADVIARWIIQRGKRLRRVVSGILT